MNSVIQMLSSKNSRFLKNVELLLDIFDIMISNKLGQCDGEEGCFVAE